MNTRPSLHAGEQARFWGHAAAFGALWGAVEATVGSFVHALRVPFGGVAMAATGAAVLFALRVLYPRRGVVLASGAVCAGVKLLSPATTLLGPMTGILVESLIVELVCLPFGVNAASAVLGGGLTTLWALSQKVLVQIIVYGAPVLSLYREFLARAEKWLGLAPAGGMSVVLPFSAVVAAIGIVGALVGRKAGLRGPGRRDDAASARAHEGASDSSRGGGGGDGNARARTKAPAGTSARHAIMAALAVLVLVGLTMLSPKWHAPLGVALFASVWFFDSPLRRGLGPPVRWLVPGLVLAVLGGALGPADARVLARSVSLAGVLAAGTMVTRAVALLTVSSSLMALCPPATLVTRLRQTRFASFGEILLVAVDLLPTLLAVLRKAHAEGREHAPGITNAPARWFEVFVTAMNHASSLADHIARDLSTLRANETPSSDAAQVVMEKENEEK